jgi:hypothetical protein
MDFKMGELPAHIVTDKTFRLLCDFLQPDTKLTMESTAEAILDLLPADNPRSLEVDCLGKTCINLASQIPYHHPSQVKLAAFLEHMGDSTKLGKAVNEKVSVRGII